VTIDTHPKFFLPGKLKPCPFCGGEAEVISKWTDNGRRIVRVRCSVCQAQSPYKANPELHGWFRWIDCDKAAEAWNRRADG
jgi:Lar family restriction alleviation protein